jgi:hypothetical protein
VWWHQQGEIALSEKTALPSIDPVDENLVVELDWQKIKAAYRAGEPLRAISEQFGIGKNVISRKAKREGWQRSGTDPGQDTGKTQEKPGTSDVVPRASDDNKDFDWYADDLVVLQEQPRTALYFNPNGALVIRQSKRVLRRSVCLYRPGIFRELYGEAKRSFRYSIRPQIIMKHFGTKPPPMMKLHDKITDAQLRHALRSLEVKGLIRSEIAGDGSLRFYAAEYRGKLVNPDEGNVTRLGNAARKLRREGNS